MSGTKTLAQSLIKSRALSLSVLEAGKLEARGPADSVWSEVRFLLLRCPLLAVTSHGRWEQVLF